MRMPPMNIAKALVGPACLGAFLAFGPQPSAAPAPSPTDRVEMAYAAMGGARLDAIKTLTRNVHLGQWDPGESYSLADPDKPGVNSSELTQTVDFGHGFVRNDWWDRPKNDDGTRRSYYEIIALNPPLGWVVGNDAATGRTPKRAIMVDGKPAHTFSGRRLTVTLRELERLNIVPEMKAHPDRVFAIADQTVNGKTYPAVQYRSDHGTFIVMFDPMTDLPARVRTPDWDALEGDSVFDAEFFDWRDVAGAKMPFHIFYTLNGMTIADMTYRDVVPNAAVPAEAFRIPPDQAAKAAKPADPRITPFHWAIRRQYSAFYFDSDTMYGDDGDQLRLVDIAPNVSQTRGFSHNTLFIATNDSLIAVEAPNDDGQSILALALAKQRYPGKPVRYLILTHHHVDHVGGMRTYAAEGATIVVGKGDGDYFRNVLARPQTLNWNAPKTTFTPKVIEVDGKWSITEGGRTIEAYAIDNPHAADYIMPYIPDAKMGIVTDLYIPGQPVPANAMVAALVKGVQKWTLPIERFAGGHGTVGPFSEVAAAAARVPAATP